AGGSQRVEGAGRMPANRPQDAGAPTAGAPTAGGPTAGAPASAPTDFESWWRKCLHDGFVPNTALPAKTVTLKSDWASALSQTNTGGTPALPRYEIVFRADPTIFDGRFANNGWLQELPNPL